MSCVIPFGELVPDANVRFVRIDGKYYMSIRDLIMVFCETNNDYAAQIWRKMDQDRKNEVRAFISNHKFSGSGQKIQDVITLPGALKLIMWLPGNAAKDFRSKTTEILTRYLAGDCTLLREIEANAASDHPVNNMARAAMEEPESSSDGELFRKRKLRREEAIAELEIQERTLALENGKVQLEKERKENAVGFFKFSLEVLKEVTGGPIDDITMLQYEEHIKNATFTGINEENKKGGVWETSRFSIGVLAGEMKYNPTIGQVIEMGKIMATQYRNKYNEEPQKHKQVDKGRIILVNSYIERDREMAKAVIKEFMERPPPSPPRRAEYKKSKSAAA